MKTLLIKSKLLHLHTLQISLKRSSAIGYKLDKKEPDLDIPINRYVGGRTTRKVRVYVTGMPLTGALGIPNFVKDIKGQEQELKYDKNVVYPHRLYMGLNQITTAACGHGFTLLATHKAGDIKLWGTGINTSSQLGYHFLPDDEKSKKGEERKEKFMDYLYEPYSIYLPIKNLKKTRIEQVACGRAHSLVLTNKEGIFTFGNNAHGQCGRSVIDGEIYRGSKLIHNISSKLFNGNVIKIECGMDHSLFLTDKGEVYSCGWSADGQTGTGDDKRVETPVLIKGDLQNVKIVDVSSFADANLALSEEGDVFGWGNTEYNQFSSVTGDTQIYTPTKLPFNIKAKGIAAGGCVCALIDDYGDVWVWGYGILGKGPELAEAKMPQKIPAMFFGRNEITKDVMVTKIACGQSHFSAITSRGEVFSWGKNSHGCLGIRSERDQFFPWKVGVYGRAVDVHCGVDHTVYRSKTFV